MNTKMRVKSYEQVKKEKEAQLNSKRKAIRDVLTSAKNNPKFAKLLSYSFTSLDKMITPPQSDCRLNAKLIMEEGGIDVLRQIALKNVHNEDICRQIANIIVKLTSMAEGVDQELALKFVESKGHEAVIELLLSKDKGEGSVPLIKTLNNLCQVPQLINKLLDAGLAESIKLVNDLYNDDIQVISTNLDTMKKVSNQKTGREFLIKKGIVPSILKNVQKCSESGEPAAVHNGLIVVDNLCRNDEGKKEVKDANAPLILCDVVENFGENDKIINKAAKILAKIMTKDDLEKELKKLKDCSNKLDSSDDKPIVDEIRDSVGLVSNLMLVDELAKTVCLPENFDMLKKLFKKVRNIDLSNKNPEYIKDYLLTNKHFLALLKRALDNMPEVFEIEDEDDPDCGFTILKDVIEDGVKKNWDTTKKVVDKLEEEKSPEAEPLKNAFKSYFSSYDNIVKQSYDKRSNEKKKDPSWIELLNYLVGDIIFKGDKYFGTDEKPNYAASNILKIADTTCQNFPDECGELPNNVKKCFPYMKNVIGFSDYWKTLTNDLDVISSTLKKEKPDSDLKKKIIPTVVNFMDQKYKFRYPNLITLYILDEYLKPEFVQNMITSKYNPKQNENYGLNYVSAIDSIMVKPQYPSSTVLKEADYDEDKEGVDDTKEPKNEETERKILVKGSMLLKRLIPMEAFLKEVKDFKKNANSYVPEANKVEDTLRLENNLIYQNCALTVDNFFKAGMNDDFNTLKDLIKKEISFIEGFKRLKANENNPKYKEICDASNKRLHLQLGTLRRLEDQGIDKFNKTKQDDYRTLLQNITNLNSEVINKSTDSPNLIEHLDQLRNNVTFIRDHEKDLSTDPTKTASDTYISNLMGLLRKAANDEDLCDSVVKTLIAFANKRPPVCNNLVKSGCPRLLLQIMDSAQSRPLVVDCMNLLKMITLSSKENAEVIGNQNILMNLLQIRSKFASVETITKPADEIANELMRLPGQEKIAEGVIRDAIKEFHTNVQKDFKDNEVKNKILGNEEVINSFTTNSKTCEPILEQPFINDLNKAVDLVTKDQEVSNTIDGLLTNDMGILKKIKDNLPSKDDKRHGDVANDTIKILLDKSNYVEPLLLACKCLGDYVKDDQLYKKHLNDKINDGFVGKLFEIQDDYLDNPEVTKEINNLLCYLAMRNPRLAESIIKRGGLANLIQELKSVANLNDPASNILKLNGLKMLNSLLNNPKNLDEFLKSDGVDLINKIIKNDVDNIAKNKPNLEDDTPYAKYFTKGTICTKTPEQLKEEEKLGINSFANIGLTKEEGDKKRDEILQDLENKQKNGPSEEPTTDDSDSYLVQCLKIINKGLDNGKNEFVDDKTVQNLTNLATLNFPDKHLFNEVATILSNKDVKLNPDNVDDLKDLMKLGLSNQAQYFKDNNVADKVKAIEDKIAGMLMNKPEYTNGFRTTIIKKGFPKPKPEKKPGFIGLLKTQIDKITGDEELPDKNRLLTYLSLATEPEEFQKVFGDLRPEIGSFFNHMVENYRPVIDKILNDKENKVKDLAMLTAKNALQGDKKENEKEPEIEPFNLNDLTEGERYDEGVVIALAKLYNYLLDQAKYLKGDNTLDILNKNASDLASTKRDAPAQKPAPGKPQDKQEPEADKPKVGFQFVKINGDKLTKYSQPEQRTKVGQLFGDRNLEDDLEDQDEQDGAINYFYRKVLGQTIDKPEQGQLGKISGDTKMDDVYGQVKTKSGNFKTPDEGIQLVKVIGNINPKDVDHHIKEAKGLYERKDKDGNAQGTTVQCVKVNRPNSKGVKEPVQYVKATRGKTKPGEDPIAFYRLAGNADIRDVLDQIQKNGKPNGKDGVDYVEVKGDELPEAQKLFANDEDMPKTYFYSTNVRGDKPYGDGKVHSVTILTDPNNNTNKNNKVKDVFRKAEESQGKRKPKPKKDNATYYYTKLVGSKNKKPEDIKLTKVPKDTDMKEIYNKMKPTSSGSKKPTDGKDDGVLVLKVTGDVDLKDVLDQIKSNSLVAFKPEEERQIEQAQKEAPLSRPAQEPKLKSAPQRPAGGRPADVNYPAYDYNKVLGSNKDGNYVIGGIKILGDELYRYDDPVTNYKVGKLVDASEVDNDEDKIKGDKTPVYYYTHLVGDKMDNLKEGDIDLVRVEPDKNMNDVEKDVVNKLRGKSGKSPNNDGVHLIKTLGKPDKKDIIKFILDSCRKDVPATIQYIKVSGTKWSKPGEPIYYIKITRDNKGKPGESGPELYFKVAGDKDINDALDQLKDGRDLFSRPVSGDKFDKVTGEELEDAKRFFNDKDRGAMRPTDISPVPINPNEPASDYVPEMDSDCVTTKVLNNGVERIDNDDEDLECIKVSGDQLKSYGQPSEDPHKIRSLFKEADDDKAGINYYYRKVLGSGLDKPVNDELIKVTGDTDIEDLYNQIKNKEGNFKSPEEGIQLVKVVGDINPDEISGHMGSAKTLYENKDGDDGGSGGTTVQCIKTSRPDKNGQKEPVQYIKAKRSRVNPGEEPISYYRVKGDADVRSILDQVQSKGKPDGTDGVDYFKIKDDELPGVQKLFSGNEDMPKTYFYTSNVKGRGTKKDGKPYGDGKVHSVTVLSDHDNRTNKNFKVHEVFRKAEEQNEKKEKPKDDHIYYYTKTLGSLLKKEDLKSPQVIKVAGDTEMRDIYNKVKGEMTNKPGDENDDLFLIKAKGDKNLNDLLDQIKVMGNIINRAGNKDAKPSDQPVTSVQYVKVGGDDMNKPNSAKQPTQYIKVTGGLLNRPTKGSEDEQYFKVVGDGDVNQVVDQLRSKGSNWIQPDNKNKYVKLSANEANDVKDYFNDKGGDESGPTEYFFNTKVLGGNKDASAGGNGGKIRSVIVKGDSANNLNKGKQIGQFFKHTRNKGTPKYYYTKVLAAGKNKPESMQLNPANGETNMNDLYKTIGGVSSNPNDDEGIQIIKVYGDVDPSEIGKHLQQSENTLNKVKPSAKPESYFFENKVLGKSAGKPGEQVRKGKVDSITIKRDPNNDTHKGKDIETVFKEGEDEEDKGNDLGTPIYYFTKLKGGVATKPEDVRLYQANGKNKLDDLYNEIKKLGPLDPNDCLQVYKVSGDVDNNNLLLHVKEAGELFNNPEDDKKNNEPTTSYYTTEVMGEAGSKPGDENLIQSVVIKRDPNNELNQNKNIEQVFNSEEADQPGVTPVYYACKVDGKSFRNPDVSTVQLINCTENTGVDDIYNYVKTNLGMSDKPGEKDGIQIFKVTGDIPSEKITEHLQESRQNAPSEVENDATPSTCFYETKVLGDGVGGADNANVKGSVKSITIKKDPNNELNKAVNVKNLFKEADPEGESESPAYYYYTKVLNDDNIRPDQLDIKQVTPDTNIDDIYNQLKLKGGLMQKPEDKDGIVIFKVVGDADNKDIIDHINKAGNKRKAPGDHGKLKSKGDKKPGKLNKPSAGKDGQQPEQVVDSGEYKIYGDKINKDGNKKGPSGTTPGSKPMGDKPTSKTGRPTNVGGSPAGKPTLDDYGSIKLGGDTLPTHGPKTNLPRSKDNRYNGPELEKIDTGDDDVIVIKVSGDKLENYTKPEYNVDQVHNVKNIFKDEDEKESGVKYYYRKVLGKGIDKPDNIQLIQVEPTKDMNELYDQIKSIGDGLTSPEEGIQLVKVIGDINPNDITGHMNDAKGLYEDKGGDGNRGTTVQCVKVSRPNKNGVKEPVQYIKATRGKTKPGEEPVSYYRVKGGTDARNILDQIQSKGKPDGTDGVDYFKVKEDELPDVTKLFDGGENMPKTYYYTSKVLGNGTKKDGRPYGDGNVQSVTILSDHNNNTNKKSQVKDVFRKAEEANQKQKDPAKYYYTKLLGVKGNKDLAKNPQVNNVPGETPMKDIYNKVKGGASSRPEDDNNGVLLIKVKGDKSLNDVLDNVKTAGNIINRPGQLRSARPAPKPSEKPGESKPIGKDGKPDVVDNRPGFEKVDVGDDRFHCVKVTGSQLNNYSKPDNKDLPNKVRQVFKEADEDNNGVNYYYRKVLGDGVDRPDSVQLIKVEPTKDMEELYNQIKTIGGGINKPDEGIQLVKVVGNVDPNEINKHMNDTKKLYEDQKGGKDTGTSVQCIKTYRPDKTGKKEITQYIKAKRNKPKAGEEPISYYKLIGDKDARDILDQIQSHGKPDGKDGDDYIKIKDSELPEVQKLFQGGSDTPQTFYYTSPVVGGTYDKNGEPYGDGKVQSVTILSDPTNKTNKNNQVKDVFRKADEANEKNEKDNDKYQYYYTKSLGDLLNKDNKSKDLPYAKITGDTNMKDVYNKLKPNMTNKPGDENDDVFLVKVPSDKNIDDVLHKIKVYGNKLTRQGGQPGPQGDDSYPTSVGGDGYDRPAEGVNEVPKDVVYGALKLRGERTKKPDEKPAGQKPGSKKKPDDEDDEALMKRVQGKLSPGAIKPDDPKNNEYVNNLEVMADPIYKPENYIFVKEFENEMDKIMNKLGKFEKEPDPKNKDDKVEVSDNYLSHLNNLYTKVVPFLDDLHKEMQNTPEGELPEIQDEKEENLDRVLVASDLYYKTDEDPEVKSNNSKKMCDACINLIDDFSKPGRLDMDKYKYKPQGDNRERKIPGKLDPSRIPKVKDRVKQLWNLVGHAVKNDDKGQIMEPENAHKVRDIIKKVDDAVNDPDIQQPKLRSIPRDLSKQLKNEDDVGQDILDFALKDLKKNGNDPEIEDYDSQTLCNLSEFPGFAKQITKDPDVWNKIKGEYLKPNLPVKNRVHLSQLIKNALKSNYNVESMINDDAQGIKNILDKIINDPVKSLDDGGRDVAENEVETLCNLLKDDNNYNALVKGDILTKPNMNKLETLYKDLDPKIGEPLRPIIAKIKEGEKAKKEKDVVQDDENKIKAIQDRVGKCFENHRRALMNFASINREGKKPTEAANQEAYALYLNNLATISNDPNDQEDKPLQRRTSNLRASLKNNELLKNNSSLLTRKLSFVSGTLLFNQDNNAKIQSSLSTKQNPEMTNDLAQILSLLRKNYNDMKNSDDIDMNIKRADNVQKCLTCLKKMSLAPDNHKPILEGGFMNFLEKLDKDYKLFKDDGTPDVNNKNLGFDVSSKNVLQACSNSDNAIPIIAESPVFDSTIGEVLNLYNKPELIAANGDVQKIFLYDNVIFSNLCKDKKAFDKIFNKIGLDKLLNLGKKTGNVNLLDACMNMLKNYIKNTPDKEKIPPEVLDTTFQILDKCIKLKDRNAPLMSKVLDVCANLYTCETLKPRVEGLHLLRSINNDMPRFKNDHQYLNSALNCLSLMTKDNPYNGQEAINCGLFKTLNDEVSKVLKDGPEKYANNKDKEDEDPNGYLKTCFNLAKLYNSLVKNDMDNVDKFNQMGVTENTVQILDTFNDKMQPLTPEEKQAEDDRKAHLLKSAKAPKPDTKSYKLVGDRMGKMPRKDPGSSQIQFIRVNGRQLENLADPNNVTNKQYTTGELFSAPDNSKKTQDIPNPQYYYIKLLGEAKRKPPSDIEKIDTGDDDCLIIKVRKNELEKYGNPGLKPEDLKKVRHMFKEADEAHSGVECYYRRVYGQGKDHPETATFTLVPVDTRVEDLYNKLIQEEGEFKTPQEGVQLMKVIGNVDPIEKNKHAVEAKKLYDRKDKDGISSGTTVQNVKITKNKNGKKETINYIKAVLPEPKPGQKEVTFYKLPEGANLRKLLEEVQANGKPNGTNGVDYILVEGDEIAEAQKAFEGTLNDPKTYYYSNEVGKDGKINSVTILADPTNRLNKKNQLYQVFRKAEEANERMAKDNYKYYYTKAVGGNMRNDNVNNLQPTPATRETDMGEIYRKVKGEMSNRPDDDEYVFLIKLKGDRNVKDALNKIKSSGAMEPTPKSKPGDNDDKLNKIRGDTRMKQIYHEVGKPNGALLVKAPGNTDYDEIIYQAKLSGLLKKRPEDDFDDDTVTTKSGKPMTMIGRPKTIKGNGTLQYLIIGGDEITKYDKPGPLKDLFRGEGQRPQGPVQYLYRTISNPTKPSDYDCKDVPGNKSLDDLYQQLKQSGVMSNKPGEGVQLFKVTGTKDPNDMMKHIKDSEALYKTPEAPQQVQVQSVVLYPKGKENKQDAIQYVKISGGGKPDKFLKTPIDTDLNDVLQQLQKTDTPLGKDGRPFETANPSDVAQYFQDKNLDKPKGQDNDTTPKSYFYTSKAIGKRPEDGPTLIQSVSILCDGNNDLNKGANVEALFSGKTFGDQKANYYFTPYSMNLKGDISLKPCDKDSKMDDVFYQLKQNGAKLDRPGEGYQLVRTTGNVTPQDVDKHLNDARNKASQPGSDGKVPASLYYKTQVLGDSGKKSGGAERIGKVDSVTIKRDPNNDAHRGKDIETVFKEGEDEDDKGNDLGTPKYYFAKLKGGVTTKPEDVGIYPANGKNKLDDVYNEVKKLGPLDKNDCIQLYKVCGNVDSKNLLDHVKEAGELFNNPADDNKSDEPTSSYYTTEVMGSTGTKGGDGKPGNIESVTVVAPDNYGKQFTVGKVFNKEDGTDLGDDIPNPDYYYTKLVGGTGKKPQYELVKVPGDTGMQPLLRNCKKGGKDDGTMLFKVSGDTNPNDLLQQIYTNGLTWSNDEPEVITQGPNDLTKLINGNIPLNYYVVDKPDEGADTTLSTSMDSDTIVPDDNEDANEKQPKEMVRDIMKYSIGTLDQITVAPTSNEFLAKRTTFGDTISKTLENDNNDNDYLLTALHTLGNYLFNESGPNYSKLDLAKTYNLLHELQSKYYANPEILTQVNYIAGSLIKNLKEDPQGKQYTQQFYSLIPESTKCQDHNPELVLLSMKLMSDGLAKKPFLIDEVYDETVPVVLSLMKLYKDNPEIQKLGYNILSQFAKNKVYAASLINNGILPAIHQTLENALFSDMMKETKPIKAEVYKLLANISQDQGNAPRIADELMGQLISEIKDNEPDNIKEIVTLLNTLLDNNQCVPPFIQYDGIDACIKLLKKDDIKPEFALNLFQMLKKVANASDEYKKMLQEKGVPDLVNKIIKKIGVYDKKLEYEGRQLLFVTNLCKVELEDPNKIHVDEIKIVEPIPPEVKNFLTNGKQVKIINNNGDVKPMQLIFTQDLMKVSAKKLKSNLPPKPKYIIDTLTIKKILKGHGTDAFKKSKGLFRSIPKPENCFSIIGPTDVEGTKALNVECENEKDVDRWIKYLSIVMNYFKKTKGIKGNILIKK